MIKQTFAVSEAVSRRTPYDILASLVEEVGELSTEVAIKEGYSKKFKGKDGVIGESIDVIICALDMIWQTSPNTSTQELEEEIMSILTIKLAKWRAKSL